MSDKKYDGLINQILLSRIENPIPGSFGEAVQDMWGSCYWEICYVIGPWYANPCNPPPEGSYQEEAIKRIKAKWAAKIPQIKH